MSKLGFRQSGSGGTSLEQFLVLYTEVMKRILLFAQTALPPPQYDAFRKLVMDAFGDAEREARKGNGPARDETN